MADIINNENAVETPEVNVASEIENRRAKLANLIESGKNPFEIMKYDVTAYSADIKANFEEWDGKTVSLAGRIMSRRDMGKANFIDLADGKGRIQCYIRINDVGEDVFADYRKWDIGDIIGIEGFVFLTRRGEISTLLPFDAYSHRRTWPSGVFTISGDIDNAYILTTIELAQSLFDYDGRATQLLIDVRNEESMERTRDEVQRIVGEEFRVVTRLEQQAALYRIMKYEKWGIFFISLLVLIIASFSIVGALAMLIIEKRDEQLTLRSLGADTAFIRRIFLSEGLLIGGLGALAGTLIGVGITLAQEHIGLVEMPTASFVMQYYPVEFRCMDLIAILAVFTGVVWSISQLTVRNMIPKPKRR